MVSLLARYAARAVLSNDASHAGPAQGCGCRGMRMVWWRRVAGVKTAGDVSPSPAQGEGPMSRPALPPAIVAASDALALALSSYAAAHPDVSLATLEADVLAAVRTALPALLHAVLHTTLRPLTT